MNNRCRISRILIRSRQVRIWVKDPDPLKVTYSPDNHHKRTKKTKRMNTLIFRIFHLLQKSLTIAHYRNLLHTCCRV